MAGRGLRTFLLYALGRQMQHWSGVLLRYVGAAAEEVPMSQLPATGEQAAASDLTQDAPPVHWLRHTRSSGPPAHWLAMVRRYAPQLLDPDDHTNDWQSISPVVAPAPAVPPMSPPPTSQQPEPPPAPAVPPAPPPAPAVPPAPSPAPAPPATEQQAPLPPRLPTVQPAAERQPPPPPATRRTTERGPVYHVPLPRPRQQPSSARRSLPPAPSNPVVAPEPHAEAATESAPAVSPAPPWPTAVDRAAAAPALAEPPLAEHDARHVPPPAIAHAQAASSQRPATPASNPPQPVVFTSGYRQAAPGQTPPRFSSPRLPEQHAPQAAVSADAWPTLPDQHAPGEYEQVASGEQAAPPLPVAQDDYWATLPDEPAETTMDPRQVLFEWERLQRLAQEQRGWHRW